MVNAVHPERRRYLHSVSERIGRELARLEKLARGSCSADEIIWKYRRMQEGKSFLGFMKSVIVQLEHLNRERCAESYRAAFRSFFGFYGEKDVLLDDMTSDLMQEYEAYLKARGVTMNTVSFYMRILRAVYNRAVEKGIAEQNYPFRHVYTGIDKTSKRALTLKDIRQIKDLDLTFSPVSEFARDMFLFSFYTRGMSFIDMAYLRKSDIKNGVLVYRRRKTGQYLSIRWEGCMRRIVDKYGLLVPAGSPYLLPIITDTDARKARQQYKGRLYSVNFNLKRVAKRLSLPIPLTTYVARHSWASIAKNKNIPLSVISEGMGHDSESTTQIYLASLERSVIDDANALILKDL